MVSDDAFIQRLITFGLGEKEAQLYLQLLKYGPKSPSLMKRSLKTYREDVHRTLASLMDKGMVRKCVDQPTLYTAVGLEEVLESALEARQHEIREMEGTKQELEELLKDANFRASEEFCTFKVLNSIRDVMVTGSRLIASAEEDIVFIAPPRLLPLASRLGTITQTKTAIQRGVRVRCITDISHKNIDAVREHLDIGIKLRHRDKYRGITLLVVDGRQSISAINADVKSLSLDESVTAIWSDSPSNAEYLTATFEIVWEQSVDAAERIRELTESAAAHT